MRIKPIESINELLKHDTAEPLEFRPVIVGRSTFERVIARMRNMAIRIIGAIFVVVLLSGSTSSASLECADVSAMRVAFDDAVKGFNAEGRLHTSGVAGGVANNLWQTVSHPSDPANMGCEGQSQRLFELMNGQKFAGWNFQQRFEVGAASPILLPHAWITATDVHGHVIDLDPWTNEFHVHSR